MSKIFRDEVIESQRYRLHGNVAVSLPRKHWALSVVIVALVLFIGVYLVKGSYVRKEHVQGFLVPDRGVVKIRSDAKQVVEDCVVSAGDKVEIGDRLCSLSSHHGLPGDADRDTEILTELRQKKRDTEKLLDQWRNVFRIDSETLNIEKESFRRKLLDLEELIETHRRREELSANRLSTAQNLKSKGHLSSIEHQKLEALYLERRLETQRADQQMNASRDALERLEKQIVQLPFKWELKRLDLETRLSDIDQKITEIEGRISYVVRSPIKGRVTAFQAVEGQTVDPSIPLMVIIPENSRMMATLLVPGRAMGFISHGQSVLFRYAAFPYQRYGLHRGQIEDISKATLSPREISGPVLASEPVYKVLASLEKESVSAYGKEIALQAGMLLEADIVQDDRSLLQWLLDPVYRFRGVI